MIRFFASQNAVGFFSVTFFVTYLSEPVEGAKILIDGKEYETNSSGEVTVRLKAGTYAYTATHPSYDPLEITLREEWDIEPFMLYEDTILYEDTVLADNVYVKLNHRKISLINY